MKCHLKDHTKLKEPAMTTTTKNTQTMFICKKALRQVQWMTSTFKASEELNFAQICWEWTLEQSYKNDCGVTMVWIKTAKKHTEKSILHNAYLYNYNNYKLHWCIEIKCSFLH